MHGTAFEEAVEGVSASLGEVWAKAIPPNILHFVLVWERGDRALWVLFA